MTHVRRRNPPRHLFPMVAGTLASLSAGGLLWASRPVAHAHPAPSPLGAASPPSNAADVRSPLADVVAEQEQQASQTPRFVTENGIRLEDEEHVRSLLSASVRCMFWTGAYSDQRASVLDLLRLRRIGYASLPTDYEVHHEQRDGADYVVIREHLKNRDGADLHGMPGYVDHLYLDDVQRGRFEHVRSTPEDPDFDPTMLRDLADPVQFLAMHSDAVCNGRRALPEVRAELMRKQREMLAAQHDNDSTDASPSGSLDQADSASRTASSPASRSSASSMQSPPPAPTPGPPAPLEFGRSQANPPPVTTS